LKLSEDLHVYVLEMEQMNLVCWELELNQVTVIIMKSWISWY